MKLLLDTHILLWAIANDERLPARARLLIEDAGNDIFFSSVSPWEVQIKHQAHPEKLRLDASELVGYCKASGFHPIPVRCDHVLALDSLQRKPGSEPHRDPFDRILICQASVEGMAFITHDERLADYTDPCVFPV